MPDTLLVLVSVGVTGLLVLLRLDAARFGAAEYNETDRWGRRPSVLQRLAWYVLGIVGVVVVAMLHPAPTRDLYLGLGDRFGSIAWGFLYATGGTGIALGIAYYRYQRLRFPAMASYPGALVNGVATAFVDEAVFRGLVFGFIIAAGVDPTLGNVIQVLVYALATRLGAPGRPWYMLVFVMLIGLVGGWLTAVTGGIGAAFLGHAVTRFAFFLTTGHAGQPATRDTEVEEVEARRRTPDGWRQIGPREPSSDR
jgi:membrane protease YdiL (CAAX protease family)